jgi:hypothetical protein
MIKKLYLRPTRQSSSIVKGQHVSQRPQSVLLVPVVHMIVLSLGMRLNLILKVIEVTKEHLIHSVSTNITSSNTLGRS